MKVFCNPNKFKINETFCKTLILKGKLLVISAPMTVSF